MEILLYAHESYQMGLKKVGEVYFNVNINPLL
jgi:hypothetical protein